MADLEAPAAPGPLSKEPALIFGVLLAIVNGLLTIAGAGAFDDGFQLLDLVPIVGPVLIALGIRQSVFSQASVDEIQPNRVDQLRAVRRRQARKRG